jgi:hypothetical protein
MNERVNPQEEAKKILAEAKARLGKPNGNAPTTVPDDISDLYRNGRGSAKSRIDDVAAAETKRLKDLADRIKVRHFKEIKLSSECRHLVYNLIPRRGLVVVWGPPKCGKSFWVYDLLMHISRGVRYRGKDVVLGAVVYCMFEGQGGADTRAEAYRQEILKDEDPGQFYDITIPLDLIKDHPALIMAIRRQLGEVKPVAITLDTLNRSLFGSESSGEDMAAYIRAAGAIIEVFDCAVIVIHHCGHNAERPRGHSALLGAEDAEIAVKRLSDDKTIVAEVIRMKDGPEGETVAFTLRTVTVGQDERGNDQTSCIVEPCDSVPVEPKKARAMQPKHRLGLDALDAALINHGELATSIEVPPGTIMVHADHWRAEIYNRGVLDRNNANPTVDFKRLWQKLASERLIGQRDNRFWRVQTTSN